MGQTVFKPTHISIDFKDLDENNDSEIDIDILKIAQTTKRRINELFKKYFDINLQESSENYIISRTRRRRHSAIINNEDNEEEWIARFPRLEYHSNIRFFTDKYSMDELEEYLSKLSSGDQYFSSFESSEEIKLEEINFHGEFEMSCNDISKLTKDQLLFLCEQKKILLKLSEKPKYALQLKAFLDNLIKKKIIGDVIDIEESNNTAISIAILHRNVEALCHLIQKRAHIPIYIYTEELRIPFLNYIASNGKMLTSKSGNHFILTKILNILITEYKVQDIQSYLCEIDTDSGLSLPHLLLILYQKESGIKDEITECLKLCHKACPVSTNTLCNSHYCCGLKFNVIAHSIILPVTNFEILKYYMDHEQPEEYLIVYENLVQVHQDQDRRNKLFEIINEHKERFHK